LGVDRHTLSGDRRHAPGTIDLPRLSRHSERVSRHTDGCSRLVARLDRLVSRVGHLVSRVDGLTLATPPNPAVSPQLFIASPVFRGITQPRNLFRATFRWRRGPRRDKNLARRLLHPVAVSQPVSSTHVRAVGAQRRDAPARSRASAWLLALARDLAPHDWLILVYFCLLFVGIAFGAGPNRDEATRIVAADVAGLLVGLALTRGDILTRGGFASALLYRVTLLTTVLLSYFQLRVILPAAAPRSVDSALYAIDLNVFHYEPSLAWDRFVNPHTTEWFAFFYFGYFFLLAIHVFPFMLAVKNMAMLARFATAIFTVFCCGHLLYILVPGFGPYRYLAGSYQHELVGGVFWKMVEATVSGAGAQKDIFPSLHTAVPTMFAILAFRHRKEFRPFRLTWPIVAFCAFQIVIATMFLRWHYLIDICAGLGLATLAALAADKVVRWDDERRVRLGLPPAWEPIPWRRG
jgi:hypothetical protein